VLGRWCVVIREEEEARLVLFACLFVCVSGRVRTMICE